MLERGQASSGTGPVQVATAAVSSWVHPEDDVSYTLSHSLPLRLFPFGPETGYLRRLKRCSVKSPCCSCRESGFSHPHTPNKLAVSVLSGKLLNTEVQFLPQTSLVLSLFKGLR